MGMGDILRRSAIKFPNKNALIFEGSGITYQELNDRVNRLANSLLNLGIKKGERISYLLHNGPEMFEIYFASAKIGSILAPVNNMLKQRELKQILQYVSPRLIFVDPDYQELITSMSDELESLEFLIGLKKTLSTNFKPYEFMIEQGDPKEPEVHVSNDDVQNIILTSGTTGTPKGAMRTHGHNHANAMAEALEQQLQYDDRAVIPTPPYHVVIESVFNRHIMLANTIIILREGGFDPEGLLDLLSREKITTFLVVPTMIIAMLQVENIEKYDLSHLRRILYAGSPIPAAVLKRAIGTFDCDFIQGYGQTEAGPSMAFLRPEDHILEGSDAQLARLASCGRPILNYEIKVVDDQDKDVPVGEVGEIIVRGAAMTIGYWDLPEETENTLRGGWLHTGDIGKLDGDGYIYVVDRRNDMIITGGKNVYPREIEEILYQHPAVLEATVIGVPDDHWVEAIKALVVLNEGMEASEEEIINYCKENLASYKKPRTVEFMESLPKSPTGKIAKREIREKYWKGLERRV